MYEAPVIERDEEEALLQEWFDTVHFDVEDQGIPELDPEVDDEEPESRAIETLMTVDTEKLLDELRKREPDNPF